MQLGLSEKVHISDILCQCYIFIFWMYINSPYVRRGTISPYRLSLDSTEELNALHLHMAYRYICMYTRPHHENQHPELLRDFVFARHTVKLFRRSGWRCNKTMKNIISATLR